MTEIRRGTLSEYWQIIDFIDYVFSKNSEPHDFPARLPNLYRQTEESMNNLVNLWEDGVIKSSVLAYPRTFDVGGTEIHITGIGSVATHPRARGRGFMQQVMWHIINEMKEKGIHMSYLGGDRKRYNHYGYELCGSIYTVTLSGHAVRRFDPDFKGDGIEFIPFEMNDTEVMQKSMALYATKPLHYIYDEADFYLRMVTYAAKACGIYKDGRYVGFCSMNTRNGCKFKGLCLTDDSLFTEVMYTAAAKFGEASCDIGEWDLPMIADLCDKGGTYSEHLCGLWLINRWKEVLDAFVRFKSGYAAIPEGKLVVDIEGAGRFKVEKGGVTETDETADLEPPSRGGLWRRRHRFGRCFSPAELCLPSVRYSLTVYLRTA